MGENATFRAKKAGFKNPFSNGRFLRLNIADGDLAINKGNSKVKVVTKTATHYSEGTGTLIVNRADNTLRMGGTGILVYKNK